MRQGDPTGRLEVCASVVARYLRALGQQVTETRAAGAGLVVAGPGAEVSIGVAPGEVDELVAAGFDPEVLRLAWLATPWTTPVTAGPSVLDVAHERLVYLYGTLLRINDVIDEGESIPERGNLMAPVGELLHGFFERFHAAMCDGLDTPTALTVVEELARAANVLTRGRKHGLSDRIYTLAAARSALVQAGGPLGLLQGFPDERHAQLQRQHIERLGLSMADLEGWIAARTTARAARDFAAADAIMAELQGLGLELMDGRWGTRVAVRRTSLEI